MCGRFALFAPREEIEALFELAIAAQLPPRYNIAPTQQVAAVRLDRTGARELAQLRWGLIPFWAREAAIGHRMINARAESVADKPAYREPFRRGRRCLIPASGFYEWTTAAGGRQPYFLSAPGQRPFAMAGLWDRWVDRRQGSIVESLAVLTVPATGVIAELHDRMPLILPRAQHVRWLDPAVPANVLRALLEQPAGVELELRAVSRAVNDPRNDGPAVLEVASL